jgi:DNA-binding transcriptional ArsR family regulator
VVKCQRASSLDNVFGALANPTRRRILELLARTDSCVTDIAKPFAVSLPAISKHLRVLENAGLIQRHRDGRVHRLQLEAEPMRDAAAWIERYREFWDEQFVSLSHYLEKQQEEKKDEP